MCIKHTISIGPKKSNYTFNTKIAIKCYKNLLFLPLAGLQEMTLVSSSRL